MNKNEFVLEMQHLKTLIDERDKIINSMREMGFRVESPIFDILYKYENALIKNIAKRAGEELESSWCEWFVFENDFGDKGFEAYIKDKKYKITSVEELYDFINLYYKLSCFREKN